MPSNQMEDVQVGLQASLLVRSPETGELFVNFDPEILTQIREVTCMTRMNLEIPPFAAVLQQKHDTLKLTCNKLQVGITHTFTHLQICGTYASNMRCISSHPMKSACFVGLRSLFFFFSFQLMLSENKRVRAKIQSVFEQLVTPHVAKVSYGNVMIVGDTS